MSSSTGPVAPAAGPLLGPAEIRALAERAGIRPTKTLGQNFVLDGGTVRKIVRQADVVAGERVVEVGPGLGSLTLGLLEAGADVVAVEIDPVLGALLPDTVRRHVPGVVVDSVDLPDVVAAPAGEPDAGAPAAPSLTVVRGDALDVRVLPGRAPTALVANLPYNVSVPVLLTFLERFPTLERVLVMVQAEVADRLAAPPGSRTYGVPSAKVAWYASARRTATVGRSVFWPAPNVDSALVRMDRREPPAKDASADRSILRRRERRPGDRGGGGRPAGPRRGARRRRAGPGRRGAARRGLRPRAAHARTWHSGTRDRPAPRPPHRT